MRYHDPMSGVVLVTVEDFETMSTLPASYDEETNLLTLYLKRGWYDGDDKTILLMKNEPKVRICVKCSTFIPDTNTKLLGFGLTKPGQSLPLVWSDRFKSWWFKNGSSKDCFKESDVKDGIYWRYGIDLEVSINDHCHTSSE